MKSEKKDWSTSLTVSPTVVSAVVAALGLILFCLDRTDLLLLATMLLLSVLCRLSLAALIPQTSSGQCPLAISQLLNLMRDEELAEFHGQMAAALEKLSLLHDPIFRQLATQHLARIMQQTQALSGATIEYQSTESWRVAYEQLLRSPGLHLYRSIAHIESPHYWQDGPGQQSTNLNLELQEDHTVGIERIAIVADHLWSDDSLFPVEPIRSWLDQQYRHDIRIFIVRESLLVSDTDLLTDLGIYGNRAVGQQISNPAGRTVRFVLSFDYDRVQRAEVMWNRLLVYAISYQELLDQQH